jgi:hypothetical protein
MLPIEPDAERLLKEWRAVASKSEKAADAQLEALIALAQLRASREARAIVDVQLLNEIQSRWVDQAKPSFEAVREATKQILTLSTAVLGLSLTFWEKTRLPQTSVDGAAWLVVAGWAVYSVSILFGVLTLQALAGNLERPQNPLRGPSIYTPSIRLVYGLHLYAFVGATVLLVVFGATRVAR